ncbi:uncharacterized protein LOC127833734 [Dreissena polymorpha]|uniref:uncharacterized protein LOC127833734 n=1 Tax=Dreissena polymorpha TaxID=45954 RepID=UPI002264E802|nr:uncharacterized protein LOC127833734 [Dreissena polymorpha]
MGIAASSSESSSWKSKVEFHEDNKSREYEHYQLTNCLLDALGHDEYIKHMKIYSCDIINPQDILSVFVFFPILYFVKHKFIVFQTNKWWYSLEKDNVYITIQRGKTEKTVKDQKKDTVRTACEEKTISFHKVSKNSISVHSLIHELNKKDALKIGYNLANRNCNHFVDDVLKWLPEITNNNKRASITLKEWHVGLENYLKNKQIKYDNPRRIFFVGTTCFPLSGGQVLEPTGASIVEQDHMITVLTMFNASGEFLLPRIVYPKERDNEIDRSGFDEASFYSVPDGWASVNSETFGSLFETLQTFVTNQRIGLPIILFVNGHSKDFKQQGIEFCEMNRMYLYDLFKNPTKFLQDPMTLAWQKAAKQWKNTNKRHTIPINKFTTVFSEAWKQFATLTNARNGFQEYSLLPRV